MYPLIHSKREAAFNLHNIRTPKECIMKSSFGKTLRNLMVENTIKESELAAVLSYDPTYISKWISGTKLPSTKNADHIIAQIASFLYQQIQVKNPDNMITEKDIISALSKSYLQDRSEESFLASNNPMLSFSEDMDHIDQMIREAIQQALRKDNGELSLLASYNLLKADNQRIFALLEEFSMEDVSGIVISQVINAQDLQSENSSFAKSILHMVGRYKNIELEIYENTLDIPDILIINSVMCMQILWRIDGKIGVAFSLDSSTIESFKRTCARINIMSRCVLTTTESTSLLKTNTQLASYSSKRQRLFFNEPPALLFPDIIFEKLISSATDESYRDYLMKLQNVFKRRTSKAEVDLVLYSSMLTQYLTDGNIKLGGIAHHLSREDVITHLKHLNELVDSNHLRIHLIREIGIADDELRKSPSLFLDEHGVHIENSGVDRDNKFLVSMTPAVRNVFKKYFDWMLEQPYCIELEKDDLLMFM